MHTLTYPKEFPTNGLIFKNDLRKYCQELRRFVKKTASEKQYEQFSAFWFMEFQERGAVHYHLFTNFDFDKHFVSQLWYRICNTNDERHLRAGTRVEKLKCGRAGTISYASKYAAKQEQKNVPDCVKNAGRFWGIYGNRTSVSAHTKCGDYDDEKCIELLRKMLFEFNLYEKSGKLKSIFEKDKGFGKIGDITFRAGVFVYEITSERAIRKIAREIAVLDRFVDMYRQLKYANTFLIDHYTYCTDDGTEFVNW